ncbi:MAG: MerR family DNA-binding transcriptional regulator, partial [Nocardioides sp.]
MHIGEVAARAELSLRSLRHWDEVGLLSPSGRT